MPPPLCDAIKNRIKQHIRDERSIATIVETENISTASVYRIIDNILAFDIYTTPRVIKRERSFKIFSTTRVELRVFIESKL